MWIGVFVMINYIAWCKLMTYYGTEGKFRTLWWERNELTFFVYLVSSFLSQQMALYGSLLWEVEFKNIHPSDLNLPSVPHLYHGFTSCHIDYHHKHTNSHIWVSFGILSIRSQVQYIFLDSRNISNNGRSCYFRFYSLMFRG